MIFKNMIPKRDYKQLLKADYIAWISISDDFTISYFPSKVLSYFGAKKPIMASINLQTDFEKMLEETNSGLLVEDRNTTLLKKVNYALFK